MSIPDPHYALITKCIRELLRRYPALDPAKVKEVVIATRTQIGDQGLTLGRVASLLADWSKTTPRLTSSTRICGRDYGDGGQQHCLQHCFGAYDVAIANGVKHIGRHYSMSEDVNSHPRNIAGRLIDLSALAMDATNENLNDCFLVGSQNELAKAYADDRARCQTICTIFRTFRNVLVECFCGFVPN